MKYLVDANVLCEPTKPVCNQKVLDWLQKNHAECAADAVVLAEICRGIDALPKGRRKSLLTEWFDELKASIPTLAWTAETAVVWGPLANDIRRAGFTVGIKDTMIAATARTHGLTVATRNVDDFIRCGVAVVNPFA